RVDEPVLAERVDALSQDAFGYLDPLSGVHLPQALVHLLVALPRRQLARHQLLAVTERVDDVHREHDLAERRGLDGRVGYGFRPAVVVTHHRPARWAFPQASVPLR